MLKIGFANEYYTLWEVSKTDFAVHCTYIKNISKDWDKVREQYPDTPFDELLRGKHGSFVFHETITFPDDEFKFGQYAGTKILNCTNYEYLAWYAGQCDRENLKYAKEVLENNGYHVEVSEHFVNVYNKELWEEMQNAKRKQQELNQKIKHDLKNGECVIEVEENPNCAGEYFHRQSNLIFVFSEVREMYYGDFNYYLPVLKGKAKRVKGKRILITEHEIIDNDKIKINNFKVLKNG